MNTIILAFILGLPNLVYAQNYPWSNEQSSEQKIAESHNVQQCVLQAVIKRVELEGLTFQKLRVELNHKVENRFNPSLTSNQQIQWSDLIQAKKDVKFKFSGEFKYGKDILQINGCALINIAPKPDPKTSINTGFYCAVSDGINLSDRTQVLFPSQNNKNAKDLDQLLSEDNITFEARKMQDAGTWRSLLHFNLSCD